MFEGDKIQLWKGSNDSDALIFSQNIDYSQNINEDIITWQDVTIRFQWLQAGDHIGNYVEWMTIV